MKKIVVFILLAGGLQYWWSQPEPKPPAAFVLALTGQTPTLYTTSWCGYCKRARAFLDSKNINYREYDIERSSAVRNQFDQYGGPGVPLLVVGEEQVRGFSVERYTEILELES